MVGLLINCFYFVFFKRICSKDYSEAIYHCMRNFGRKQSTPFQRLTNFILDYPVWIK